MSASGNLTFVIILFIGLLLLLEQGESIECWSCESIKGRNDDWFDGGLCALSPTALHGKESCSGQCLLVLTADSKNIISSIERKCSPSDYKISFCKQISGTGQGIVKPPENRCYFPCEEYNMCNDFPVDADILPV